jgi:hypothetical protein
MGDNEDLGLKGQKIERRDFVRTVGLAAGATAVLRHNVLGDVIGANDKINIGCIGVGGRGTSVMRTWR